MVHQTFVWWILYILYKFVKSPIKTFEPNHRKCPTCLTFFAYTVLMRCSQAFAETGLIFFHYIHSLLCHHSWSLIFNSLSTGGCGFDFKCVISRCIVVNTYMSISSAIALREIIQDPSDDIKVIIGSGCVFVCGLMSMVPNVVTRTQWVNTRRQQKICWWLFADFLKCNFLNEYYCSLTQIPLKSVLRAPID